MEMLLQPPDTDLEKENLIPYHHKSAHLPCNCLPHFSNANSHTLKVAQMCLLSPGELRKVMLEERKGKA